MVNKENYYGEYKYKMAKFDKQSLCQKQIFMAWHFFMHMLIISVLYVHSIRELQ